ncbi:MAG: ROK family protein [Ectothiorhodospiraceae bacterium]|nr:ROK family protein [Chromatiales bacterium]MCP5153848.1 ROK family protein [Ectothiorhodospiraceae bacterium]
MSGDQPASGDLRIGVDLGGTKIEAVAMDRRGCIVERVRQETPRGSYAAIVDAVADVVHAIERRAGARGTVGVGTPGARSPATGRMKNANSTELNGRPLGDDLARALGREVRIANDANCFALSEAVDGAGRGAPIVLGVILGTGVGGGIVVDGRVLDGRNAVAGEWGHNPLPWPGDDERPGPACYCGRRGCIETFLSGPGLAADHRAAGGGELDAAAVVALARAGDRVATATLDRYLDRLARGLAHVVNLLDPDVIVLGGGLSRVDALYREVPARWGRWIFSDRVDTALRAPVHGDASGVRGAAWLWGGPG